MRRFNIFWVLFLSLETSLAFSADQADYVVPASGSLTQAIAEANKKTNSDAYKIDVKGDHADSASVKTNTVITGIGEAKPNHSGTLSYSGSGINSEITNVTFKDGKGTAIRNGSMPGVIIVPHNRDKTIIGSSNMIYFTIFIGFSFYLLFI